MFVSRLTRVHTGQIRSFDFAAGRLPCWRAGGVQARSRLVGWVWLVWLVGLVSLAGLLAPQAQAAALRYCDKPAKLSTPERDKLLRFAVAIKSQLEQSGQPLALIARSGLDLSRFDVRYSHAGISLRDSQNTPWSVRQLYYDCDNQRPRLFDQGIAGFLIDTDDASIGYVSMIMLPADAADSLARIALDNRLALRLLSATYSANSYPFSITYQNCNQWVMEMLAAAWGKLPDGDDIRGRAQQWLMDNAYQPHRFEVHNPALWIAGAFVPWLHSDDHPPENLTEMVYQVSMPDSIEAFVRDKVPGASRIEFCHTDRIIVIHRGWEPIAEGCKPGDQDSVIDLDERL